MRVLLLILLAAPAWAGTFDMAYQRRLLDTDGAPIEGAHTLTVKLYDGSTELWSDDYSESFESGYFSVLLTDVDGDWFVNTIDVGLTIDGPGNELVPRQTLTSVAQAQVSEMTRSVATSTAPTGSCTPGDLVYDTTVDRLRVCRSAGDWGLDIVDQGGHRTWVDGSVADSCNDYKNPPVAHTYAGDIGSGVYRINPDATGAFDVWCDMDNHAGGWTQVLNLDTNDGGHRHYFDTAFWEGTGQIGSVLSHATSDHRTDAFHRLQPSEILFVAHNEGAVYGTAVHAFKSPALGMSMQEMLSSLTDTEVTNGKTAGTGSVGNQGRLRNAGDAFIDHSDALRINSRFQPVDSANYTRLGTDYTGACATVNCNGHQFGGWGGRHNRASTWGAYYEGSALSGYCNAQGGFGTNGSSFGTNNAFDGTGSGPCSGATELRDVDMMVFVR